MCQWDCGLQCASCFSPVDRRMNTKRLLRRQNCSSAKLPTGASRKARAVRLKAVAKLVCCLRGVPNFFLGGGREGRSQNREKRLLA